MTKASAYILIASGLIFQTQMANAQESITVATYGGPAGDATKTCFFDKFTQQTGIRVIPEPGGSGVTLAKLEQQRSNPTIDVAFMDGGISELADAAGVLAPIDPAKVPNMQGYLAKGIYKNAKGEVYSLSSGFYSIAITYNTRSVKTPPTSWNDLWKKEYAGAVTFPSPDNAMGLPFFMAISKTYGTGYDDVPAAVAKLKDLKVSSYFKTSGAGQNLFQSGEAIIGAMYRHTSYIMADQGLPIASVVPAEGAVAGDIRIHLVKGTKKHEAAEKLINVAASREALECMAEFSFYGPPLKEFKLSDKTNERMPWGPTGNADNLVTFDWAMLNARRADLLVVFNRDVAR